MIKFKKYLILLFLLLVPFFINAGLLITDYFAGKNIQLGSFFYSNLSNELWLNFWGNYLSGFLAFLLIFHYQEQLEHEKNLKKQELCLKEITEEKNVIKELLKKWDNSIFDEYKDYILDYVKFEEKNNVDSDKIEKLNLDGKIFQIKSKIEKTLNIDFLDVEFLNLRIQDEDVLNEIKKNKKNLEDFYQKGGNLYDTICKLREAINSLNIKIEDEIIKYQSNKIKLNELFLVIEMINKEQEEIADLTLEIINYACEYHYIHKKFILNNNFNIRNI